MIVFKTVLTVAAAAALVVTGALPATAAPATKPGAPTSVRVVGAADQATVQWSLPKSGGKVVGWTVAVTPAEQQPDNGVDRLGASARWDRFGALHAGTTYTFAVRAVGAKATTGPAVKVRYTATAAPAETESQSLFALDVSGAVVRFGTDGSTAATTIAANGAGYTADDRGDVFVPSADLTSIVMYPAGGRAPQMIATGLHLTADLRSDVAGNLYWKDSVSGAVKELPVTGGTPVTVLPSTGITWAVGRDGTVSAWTGDTTKAAVTTRTPAGTTTTRTLSSGATGVFGYVRTMIADGHGGLYVNWSSPGAAGAYSWAALPAGATTWTSAEPKLAFEYGATNTAGFRLLQSAEWCTSPAEYTPTGCGVDRSITTMVVRAADGTSSTVPVSGVTAGNRGANVGAADEDGDVFFDVGTGATPGLWRVPAAGGAAQQLAGTQYSRLLVI
jgi:hypothetical protein